jgi:hypothetical protein
MDTSITSPAKAFEACTVNGRRHQERQNRHRQHPENINSANNTQTAETQSISQMASRAGRRAPEEITLIKGIAATARPQRRSTKRSSRFAPPKRTSSVLPQIGERRVVEVLQVPGATHSFISSGAGVVRTLQE